MIGFIVVVVVEEVGGVAEVVELGVVDASLPPLPLLTRQNHGGKSLEQSYSQPITKRQDSIYVRDYL